MFTSVPFSKNFFISSRFPCFAAEHIVGFGGIIGGSQLYFNLSLSKTFGAPLSGARNNFLNFDMNFLTVDIADK